MKKSVLSLALLALLLPAVSQAGNPNVLFTKEWTFDHAIDSEISAYDAATNSIWVAGPTGVDILDLATGTRNHFLDTSLLGEINSIDIFNGTAALAIQNATRTSNGNVAFFNTSTQTFNNAVTVGALPDMVKYTADGSKLLVANEGTPDAYGAEIGTNTPKTFGPAANDPVGSVSIINTADYTVTTANLTGAPTSGSHLRQNVGMDFEPEYIAINEAGTKAFVTLQEHNGMAVLDINSASFTNIVGLGAKDYSLVGNEIDPSDRDGKIEFASHNIKGLYMPDAIESYDVNGSTYVVMANEGDFREDDGDRSKGDDFGLADPLNRITLSNTDSTNTEFFSAGGRSFSIRDESGNIVFDSGSELDKMAADLGIYDDGRSDAKGVEPEGIELLEFDGKTLAFITLERTLKSAVAVYDITDPLSASFLDMIVTDGDLAPEGIQAFANNGTTYLSIANEKSGTTSLYSLSAVAAVPEPQTYAMFLAGLAMLGFSAKRKKQA